jgi:hypothetical protein
LKLFVDISSDGGQRVSTGTCTSVARIASGEQGACRCSYLVRMIKPNSITSHDWHVQPICQRSLRVVRLSGPFWIEAQTRKSGCPRTCCARWFCVLPQLPAFLREPSKPIEVHCSCQGLFSAEPEK